MQIYGLFFNLQNILQKNVLKIDDDLIKVLDTKHIVVEVQGISPNRSDAVGIELRLYGTKSQEPSAKTDYYYLPNFSHTPRL